MNTFTHGHIHLLKPPLQHPDLFAVCVYCSAYWFRKLFLVFTRLQFHFRHCMPQQYIRNTQLGKADRGRISSHLDLTINTQTDSLVVETSAPVNLCKLAKTLCGVTLTGFLLPPDIHWQCGDLHEPLQVPAHLHARQSGGVSQQELLWAQSTHVSPPPTYSPPTHLVFMWILCLPEGSATQSLTVWF